MSLTKIPGFAIDTTSNVTFANVTVTGNLTSGNANLGNAVVANYFIGNGSLLTGLPASYSNTNVQNYLPTFTGNLSAGNANLGNLTTSNYFSGNGSLLSSINGANVTGQVANSLIAGTVTTGAQPNITSVGTLSSLTVTGDTTLTGNLTVSGGFEYANVTSFKVKDPIIEQGGNTTGAALTSNDGYDRGQLLHYYSGSSAVDAFMGYKNSAGEFIFASNVSVASEVVTVNTYGNVHAGYFIGNGSQLTGISATTAVSLINGTSNVIVTNNSNVTVGVAGNASVLTVTGSGVNVGGYLSTLGNITSQGNVSASYFIGNGSQLTGLGLLSNGNSNISITQNGPIILSAAGQYSILQVTGTGTNAAGYLTVTGNITGNNVFSNGAIQAQGALTAVNANLGNLVTANYVSGTLTSLSGNQSNITTVGTLGNLSVTGNITSGNANLGNAARANYFLGDGSLLTGIGGAGYIFNGTSNANIATANGNLSVGIGGTANVGVFTSTGLNVTGYLTATGNITSGNANLGNAARANYFLGDGSLLTGIGGAGFIFNGTSNANIATANGNLVVGINGTAGVATFANTGVNVTGTLSATGNITGANASFGNANLGNLTTSNYFSGKLDSLSNSQPNITSLGTLLNLTVTANSNIGGNVFVGNLTSSVTVANTGAIIATGNITAANVNAGNVLTANYTNAVLTTGAQPNITAIGTLGNLTVTNNVSANTLTTGTGTNANLTIDPDGTGNLVISSSTPVVMSNSLTSNGNIAFSGANVSLGSVGNLSITGGSTNQYLKTDGSGNLSWGTPAGGGGGGGTTLTYTADATPPASANIADQWYNTITNTLYEYINDGTTNYWVDIQTPTVSSASSASTGSALLVQDEGTALTYTANTLNFTGSRVTTTNSGNIVTVAIGGGTDSVISNGSSAVNILSANGNISLTSAGNTSLTVTDTGATVNGNLYANNISSSNGPLYPLTLGTAQNTTSGTVVTLSTTIPSWVKRITVILAGVSSNGIAMPLIQFGTGVTPTYVTTGYQSTSDNYTSSAGPIQSATTGFRVGSVGNTAALWIASYVFVTVGSNIWVGSLSGSDRSNGVLLGGGMVTLSDTLTAIRLTTTNGTDTFDAGSVNILYE